MDRRLPQRQLRRPAAGLRNTVEVAFLASLLGLPVGLAAAIFLSEYAGERLRKVLKPILELLAGIPTVVFGYFALTGSRRT